MTTTNPPASGRLIIQVTPTAVFTLTEPPNAAHPLHPSQIKALEHFGKHFRLQLVCEGGKTLVAFVAGAFSRPNILCIVESFTTYSQAVRFINDCRVYIARQFEKI